MSNKHLVGVLLVEMPSITDKGKVKGYKKE